MEGWAEGERELEELGRRGGQGRVGGPWVRPPQTRIPPGPIHVSTMFIRFDYDDMKLKVIKGVCKSYP